MIQQSPGRRYDDVRLLRQHQSLRHHVHAAHNNGALHSDAGAQRLKLLGDLEGQLAGGGEDQGEIALGVLQEGLEDRQGEGGGFSGARFG